MQSFLAKHSDCEEQVISDGNFLIIIRKHPYPAKVDVEYKLAKSRAKNKGAKIKHLFEKRTIVKEIKHKITRKFFKRIKIMGLPFWYNKNKPGGATKKKGG